MTNLNPLIYDVIVHHRRVNTVSTLKLQELASDLALAYDEARMATQSSDRQLQEAGRQLLIGLEMQGVEKGRSGASMGSAAGSTLPPAQVYAPSASAAQAPPPAAPSVAISAAARPSTSASSSVEKARTYEREWDRLETIAVDEAGPMAAKILRGLKEKFPHTDPYNLSSQCAEMMDKDIASAIYGRYRNARPNR